MAKVVIRFIEKNFLDCTVDDLDIKHFLDCTVDDLIPPKPENLTLNWFNQNWGRVVSVLTEYLSRKFHKSKDSDMVQDMIMDFAVKYIGNDGFRPVFESGKEPTMGSVKMFAARTTIDNLRKAGRDYSCRVNYGSKTSLEYRKDVQFYTKPIEDKVFDDIEGRIYIKERITILKSRITYGVDESRHQNLVSILLKMVSGTTDDELREQFTEKDIRRVKRFIRKDPSDLIVEDK